MSVFLKSFIFQHSKFIPNYFLPLIDEDWEQHHNIPNDLNNN